MFKLLKTLDKKDISIVVFCIMLISFQVYLDLKLPDYMSKITTLIQSSNSKIIDVLEQGFYMLLCAFCSLVAAIVVGYFASLIASRFSLRGRKI